MKKKFLSVTFVLIVTWLFFANQFIRSNYHMNIFQYFNNDHQLTESDRQFLKDHGPIIYASDNNSPPLRYYDKDAGQYRGVVIDYVKALAIELETEIEMRPMIWDDALEALKRGETDICDMYSSDARAEIYLFSDPVYYQRGVILISNDNDSVLNAADLNGLTVAVQKGDYVVDFLNRETEFVNLVYTVDYEESVRLVKEGKVDAMAGDEPVISYFTNILEMNEDFRIVDEPLYELPSVLSLYKSDKRLQSIINKGIYALTQKGTVNKIQQKWFGISTPISSSDQTDRLTLAILSAGLVAIVIVMLVVLWNFELKRFVDERTRELAINKDNLQTIIDGLSHMIVVVAPDFKIWSGNKRFYSMFEIHDFNTDHYLDQILPGFNDEFKDKFSSNSTSFEHMMQGQTYQVTPYTIEYAEFQGNATLLMFEDVTDKKIHESRLLQDNKMAAIGQLATGVAHEIRNPLGLIRNYAFLLRRNNDDKDLLRKSLSVIEESVDKASAIIDNLLNFSRLSNDELSQVKIDKLIRDIINLNDKLMNRQQIVCRLKLEPTAISTQEESLKAILLNIINNAIDAIPKKGQITIWLKRMDETVQIHIIDNGEGMSEETKEKLFEPFYTTKNVGEGTGLGLYIVYSELAKINGTINVITKPGVGTTFKINLKIGEHVDE